MLKTDVDQYALSVGFQGKADRGQAPVYQGAHASPFPPPKPLAAWTQRACPQIDYSCFQSNREREYLCEDSSTDLSMSAGVHTRNDGNGCRTHGRRGAGFSLLSRESSRLSVHTGYCQSNRARQQAVSLGALRGSVWLSLDRNGFSSLLSQQNVRPHLSAS